MIDDFHLIRLDQNRIGVTIENLCRGENRIISMKKNNYSLKIVSLEQKNNGYWKKDFYNAMTLHCE